MAKSIVEIITPTGRIVAGHPMEANAVTDDVTKLPKMQKDGITPRVDFYLGLAIPKGTEADWKQTEWGQKIVAVATAGWPNGEHAAAAFAWKVADGDSTIPNKKGKIPCEREGWPGHWIINASTGIPIKCYHVGQYDPLNQIQDKNEIKRGDYGRLLISAKDNAPSESPGVYLNPTMFDFQRAGQEIIVESGTSAADAFGGAGVAAAPAAAAAPAPAITPATDVLNPAAPAPAPAAPAAEQSYNHQGTVYTHSQLVAGNWTAEQIAALPKV